jgi:hypothetical protein
MKLAVRKATNLLVRAVPKSVTRHFLKSLWYQPHLQDALRVHVQPYRFDSAIPTRFDIDLDRLNQRRNLPGLAFDVSKHLSLLKELAVYAHEMNSIPLEQTTQEEFWFRNPGYQDADAASLYCMIRHFKPRRIIEAGCGFSSRVIGMAVRKNAAENHPAECLFIEPYPADYLLVDRLPGPLLQKKIQDVPMERFTSLNEGDILFIDTSHVIKTQNDCCCEYLQIIPSLRPGVLVHIHDILTPYDYHADWILDHQFAFNEQYALECLLTHNPRLEVLVPLYLLWKEHTAAVMNLFSRQRQSHRPSAFWVRTRGDESKGYPIP